jgi:hypothetical protein
MMTTQPLKLVALLLLVLTVGLAGCMSDDDNEANGTQTTETHMDMDMDDSATTSSPAADLRIALDRLLSEHATLAMVATQKGLKGSPDFAAIGAALDANSVELSEAIGSVYGDDAAKTFLDGKSMWRDHIEFFVAYTTALAKKDKAGQTKAVNDLKGYIEAFSGFLADATGLPQEALRKGIAEHVDQLKAQLDTYAAGDYDAAYDNERMAYDHMAMTGDTLAGGIVEQSPDKYASGNVAQSASDLRATLGKLMGEHALLAQFATQKGLKAEPDFPAIGAALDANSVELSEAIGSVYGDDAAKTFLDGKSMWRDHIEFFVAYTTALAKKDKAGQTKAVNDLKGYIEAFSGFLADATGLPQGALRTSITEHVSQLKGQIDAYAAEDYAKAYMLLRKATAHMWMTGSTLAEAIVKQDPDSFSS